MTTLSELVDTAIKAASEAQKLVRTNAMQDTLSGIIADLEYVRNVAGVDHGRGEQ